jgi:hypothetical protein
MFRDNATLTLQTNGGSASLLLAPEQFPEPQHGLRGTSMSLFCIWVLTLPAVHQRGNGVHSWSREPEYAAARYHVATFIAFGLLMSLWALARAARLHVHQSRRGAEGAVWDRRRKQHQCTPSSGSEDEKTALQAVRSFQAEEQRAADKAAALTAWHADESSVSEEQCGAASSSASAPSAGALCSVCLLRPRDVAILPCRHVAICGPCVRRLEAAGGDSAACPICRGPLDSWLELFLC